MECGLHNFFVNVYFVQKKKFYLCMRRTMKLFSQTPSFKNLSFLFLAALIIRGALFYFYVQHNERYKQADSSDYHTSSIVLAYSGTMTRFDNNEPIFWRTPGYPLFLAPFYYFHGITTGTFADYATAQKAALWLQIILCAFIPILLFFLALQLTGSLVISWITAWFSVIHLGFVLAATYLLTDALASLFFYAFLLFFYRAFLVRGEQQPLPKVAHYYRWLTFAALCLGAYTWMRPMGKFIGIFSSILLLFSYCSWSGKLKRASFFFLLFFATLSPWYLRNYQLTQQWFFCPMSGAYLEAFCAPKIVRRLTNWPLETCMRRLFAQVEQEAQKEQQLLRAAHSDAVVVKHITCGKVAWPWLKQYPWYTAYDWMVQVIKTCFDLYANQLVALANNTFSYDPLEEFLTEKMAAALYKGVLPLWIRIIAWLELCTALALWLGLLGGFFVFMVRPLYQFFMHKKSWSWLTALWLKTTPLIGAALFMTGGFGYARLRLPIEPLMIILALTFFFQGILFKQKSPR
jgi:hypothetical protein